MDLGVRGARALVTAGSKGIGRACAAALVAEGASVVISSRDAGRLERSEREMGAAGHIVADLHRVEDRAQLVEKAAGILGGLDILILNFPQTAIGTVDQVPTGAWEAGYQSVLQCAVDLMTAALPHLRLSGRGRIVQITGIAAREPSPGFVVSAAYRSAVTAMAKALSSQVAKDGVTINNLAPGHILTDQLRVRLEQRPDGVASLAASIPAGRMGVAEDVAAACVFLCSTQASYITGQTIGIDGGALKGAH
jgi:3-oxoacyl-[acyl-carrier protein] reductase